MIIKQKSMVVALTTGCIVASVLILTLVGYIAYTKLKTDTLRRQYEESLRQAQRP